MGVGHGPVLLARLPPEVHQHKVPLSYGAVFDAVRSSYEADEAELLEATRPRDRLAYLDSPLIATRRTARRRVSGPERMALLNETLDSFGYERFEEQRVFHREMTKAIIAHIFRDDLDEHVDALLLQFRCTQFCSELMIISQRRKGKTFSVAMFAAAVMIALDAYNEPFVQSIFSTGRRASQKLLDLVYRMLIRIPGAAASIETHNMEALSIRGPYGPTDVRQLFSYPSKVRGFVRARRGSRGSSPFAIPTLGVLTNTAGFKSPRLPRRFPFLQRLP